MWSYRKCTGGSGGIANETDPTIPNHIKNITEQDIENWNNKTDPTIPNHIKTITEQDINNWNNKIDRMQLEDTAYFLHAAIDGHTGDINYINGQLENKADKNEVETKANKDEIPTNISDLNNDSSFAPIIITDMILAEGDHLATGTIFIQYE